MECQYLGRGSKLARRWHQLRCRECRAARLPDATLRNGIKRLNLEPAPAGGLSAALSAFGAAPALRPARSRRWKSILSWRILPAGSLTAMAAIGSVGWLTYIDREPDIKFPKQVMPSPNAYDVLAESAKAVPESEKTYIQGTTVYTRSAVEYALASTPEKKPAHPEVPEMRYSSEADRGAHILHANKAGSHIFFTQKDKEALLEQYAPALALLRKSFAYHYQAPSARSFNAPVRYWGDYRQLAHALQLEAQVKTEKGDYTGAAESSLDAIELGIEIERGNGVLGIVIGYQCIVAGRETLWPLIDRLDADRAARYARRMEKITSEQVALCDALQDDKWATFGVLQDMFRKPGWRGSFYSEWGSTQTPAVATTATYLKLLPYSKQAIINDYERVVDRQIAFMRLPFQGTGPFSTDGRSAENSAQKQAENDPVVALLFPFVGGAQFSDIAGIRTQNALLTASLALRAFEAEQHRLPSSLNELVPKYLTAVPLDPFSAGQPLSYHSSKTNPWSVDGGQHWLPILYSIGPDGKDDGGTPIDARTASAPSSLPATASNIAKYKAKHQYEVKPQSKGDIFAGINTSTSGN